MSNTVVSESKGFCLDKVLCDRELLFNPDFRSILSSCTNTGENIRRKWGGEKSAFQPLRNCYNREEKSMKISEVSCVLLMLLDNEHSVLGVNCYRMNTGLTLWVVVQLFLITPLLGWDTCIATHKRIHLKMEAGLHWSLEIIVLLAFCGH